MTPISKVLSLLLTVLVVTSLFVPAVAADYDYNYDYNIDEKIPLKITPQEALKVRVEQGYLTQFTGADVGYWYHGGIDVWDIYINKTNSFTFKADNDEKRMKLLEFMWKVDSHCGVTASKVVGTLLIIGGALRLVGAVVIPALAIPFTFIGTLEIVTGLGIHKMTCAGYDSDCRALAEELRSLK